MMTVKTKMMRPTTRLDGDRPGVGSRVGPDGDLELMTRAEVDVLIARALNEAVKQVRPIRTLH